MIDELSVIHELIAETSDYLHTLYDAIDQARFGKISSYLIKPDQLYYLLQGIKSHLHIRDSLPIAVTKEIIYKYYDIVDLTVYISKNNLRYVIRIPLRHIARRYHLFKVIQIPELIYNN